VFLGTFLFAAYERVPKMEDDPLERVKAVLSTLDRDDQAALHRYLARRLGRAPERTRMVATVRAPSVSPVYYQEELVKCGKKACRCATGPGHGPYWYKYQRKDGRLRKEYIGKRAPTRRAATREEAPARDSSAASR
jgi:hypothetical protein